MYSIYKCNNVADEPQMAKCMKTWKGNGNTTTLIFFLNGFKETLHLQGLSNNAYLESNQPNFKY